MVRSALLLLPALQVAATEQLAGEVVKEIKYQFDPVGEYCLVPNYGPVDYTNARKLESSGIKTMEDCANLCTADRTATPSTATTGQTPSLCQTWSYVEATTGDHACYDITPLAPSGAPGSVPLKYNGVQKPMTGLAGVCNCPSRAKAGTTLTGSNFPASDPTVYATLFERSAHQPAPLACWPKNEFGQLKLAPATVQRSNQVASTDPKHFGGWCSGMTLKTDLPAGLDCQQACEQDPQCNGYQLVPQGSFRAAGCFFGAGYDCDNDSEGAAKLAADPATTNDGVQDAGMKAERYNRGYVQVVAPITKFRVNGLTKRFDESAFQMDDPSAVVQRRRLTAQVTDWVTTILRCREICESDIWCSVWQVYDGSGTTADKGCFTESEGSLGYPLVRDQSSFQADATGVKDGAFIQHWYSEDITTTTTTTTAPPPPNRLLPILLGLAGLAALLGVGAYAMGWCSPKDKPKKPKTKPRALAPEPPKEEPRPEPVPTQPSFLMSAPVLTYTAAPVTYAAPVATMQHQPMTYAAPPVTTASYQMVQPHSSMMQPHSTMPYATSVVVPQEPIVGGFMG